MQHETSEALRTIPVALDDVMLVDLAPVKPPHIGQRLMQPSTVPPPRLRQPCCRLPDEGGLIPHLTVLGNLALLPRHLGWKAARISARVDELAALTHLPGDVLARYPAELSGGQRQRVALMRALMADPDALLLDEPLGALDPVVRYELQDELKQWFQSLGKTVIIVTHDLAEAAWFADRLILMRQGAVVQDGTLADLRDRPADGFVTRFVEARRDLGGHQFDPDGRHLSVVGEKVVKRVRFQTLKSGVMFRPQDLQIQKAPNEGEDKPTTPATVAQRQNLGWLIKYTLRFDDGVECEFPVTRERDLLNTLDVGSRLHVYVDPSMMMGFDPDDIDSTPKL
ncbi:MAG: hypothetical protein WDW36_009133 [Sanguina aurantia]